MSGSWSWGRLERSPFGSVFAETWKGSAYSAWSMCRLTFSAYAGLIALRTSWPSMSDQTSPIVSSPTRVTTPPTSLSTASVAARFASQSSRVRGGFCWIALTSPVDASSYVMESRVAGSCAMS